MADEPSTPILTDADLAATGELSDTPPYPRDLFVELLMEVGCPQRDAERMVDASLGSLARVQ